MSRIGKKSINIPDNVKASIVDRVITVTGPKGELTAKLSEDILVEISDTEISVTPKSLEKKARSFWGLSRTIISNLVTGVSEFSTNSPKSKGLVIGHKCRVIYYSLRLDLAMK